MLRIIVDSPQNNGQLEELRISSLDAPFLDYVNIIYPIIIIGIMSSFFPWSDDPWTKYTWKSMIDLIYFIRVRR